MTTYNVPYTFIPGTKAKASEVNENFTTVLEHISNVNQNSADINFSNLTETAKEVIYNNSAPGRLIGEIITSSIPITDACVHLLDGSIIEGEGIYKDFVEYIGELYGNGTEIPPYFTTETLWQECLTKYGICGKFVYDFDNKTVRLPKITGIIEGTTDINALGDLVEAGLPNITGTFYMGKSGQAQNGSGTTGAFYNAGTATPGNSAQAGGDTVKFGFKASNSSSIYGKSETVQPQTIKQFVYIVIANSKKTDIMINIDNVVADLNNKANKSDIYNEGAFIAECAMPSNKYVRLTLGSSGATYTAPANGWFFINIAGGSAQYARFQNSENGMAYQYGNNNTNTCSGCIEVKKGAVIAIQYTATNSTVTFSFIYAQGSESEAQ